MYRSLMVGRTQSTAEDPTGAKKYRGVRWGRPEVSCLFVGLTIQIINLKRTRFSVTQFAFTRQVLAYVV